MGGDKDVVRDTECTFTLYISRKAFNGEDEGQAYILIHSHSDSTLSMCALRSVNATLFGTPRRT